MRFLLLLSYLTKAKILIGKPIENQYETETSLKKDETPEPEKLYKIYKLKLSFNTEIDITKSHAQNTSTDYKALTYNNCPSVLDTFKTHFEIKYLKYPLCDAILCDIESISNKTGKAVVNLEVFTPSQVNTTVSYKESIDKMLNVSRSDYYSNLHLVKKAPDPLDVSVEVVEFGEVKHGMTMILDGYSVDLCGLSVEYFSSKAEMVCHSWLVLGILSSLQFTNLYFQVFI